MMLPLPTVTDIDVAREKLRDVERRRAMPLPNIAAGVKDAVAVGEAVVEMGEKDKRRQEAQWFQKEYVDKGWDGAQKLWQETGADPSMNPQFWRTAPNAAPGAWFEMMGKKVQEKEQQDALSEYETLVASGTATPEQLSQAEIKAGRKSGKGYEAVKAVADRGAKAEIASDNITSREKIANQRAETAKEVARIRRDAAKLKGDSKAEVEFFTTTAENLQKEIEDVYGKYGSDAATRSYSLSPEDKKTIDGLARRRDDAFRNANILIRKGGIAGAGGDTTGAPKEGDTKTNSAGDSLVFRGGKWQIK